MTSTFPEQGSFWVERQKKAEISQTIYEYVCPVSACYVYQCALVLVQIALGSRIILPDGEG